MWPFKRKLKPDIPTLFFKSGEAFFEMQCKYGETNLMEGQGVVAIVLDAQKESGTSVPVKVRPDGIQVAKLRVASPDGGFFVISETASGSGDRLKPGDLVVWVPFKYMEEFGQSVGEKRSGWFGLIVAKVAPQFDAGTDELTILCRY